MVDNVLLCKHCHHDLPKPFLNEFENIYQKIDHIDTAFFCFICGKESTIDSHTYYLWRAISEVYHIFKILRLITFVSHDDFDKDIIKIDEKILKIFEQGLFKFVI